MPPPFSSKRRHGRDQVGAVLCPNGIRQSRCRVPSAVHTPRQGTQGYTSCDISFDLCHRQFVPAAADRGGRRPARECASELYRHDALRTPLIGGPGVATAHGLAHAQHLPARQDQHLPRGAPLGLRPDQAGREHFSISTHTLARCRRLRRSPRPHSTQPALTHLPLFAHPCTGARAPTTTTATSTTPPIPATGRSPRARSCEPRALGPPCEVGPTPPPPPPAGRAAREELHDSSFKRC